ncbi:MAG: hypothetical protein QXG00_06425 [Candidatus Woesearchaeota archaeon]
MAQKLPRNQEIRTKQHKPSRLRLFIEFCVVLLVILLTILVILETLRLGEDIGRYFGKNTPELFKTPNSTILQGNCSNLSLINTSYCLNEELKGFYKYNISNLGKDLTLEQFKAEGGVCSTAVVYFERRFKEINKSFYIETPLMKINQTNNHQVLIVSNEEGWCLLDQTVIGCIAFTRGELNST